MKILYYDCFAGISGDMNLGAMIDMAVPLEYLQNELAKLRIDEFRVQIKRAKRQGIEGTLLEVFVTEKNQHYAAKAAHHEHRSFHEIMNLINKSSLNEYVKNLSIKIFTLIAEAEGKIHGISPEKVHFHEVGAIDSIVDIVGAAICINYLKPERILAAPPELGSGMVKCQHGILPVPAPATIELLKGIPIKTGGVNHEATTPTGAAILASIVDEFTNKLDFKVEKTGYGIGFRETEGIPNVLRVMLGVAENNLSTETANLIECNIDDMNPEYYEYIMSRLMELGADDVFITPVIMKKTRPAIVLSVLSKPSATKSLIRFILEETTTLGLRQYSVEKSFLGRKIITVQTPWGDVRVKQAIENGRIIKSKPEYEDCLRISRERGISLRQVVLNLEDIIRSMKHE